MAATLRFPPPNTIAATPTQLLAMMAICYAADIPLLVHGQPGVAKSDLSRQFAESISARHIDTRLSQLTSADSRGVPYPTADRRTAFMAPEEFPDADEPTIWHIDELNRCEQDTQNAFLQLFLDKRLGGYTVPPSVWIMASANPDGSRGTITLHSATNTRFAHAYLVPDLDSWRQWAYDPDTAPSIAPQTIARINPNGHRAGIDPLVIAFVGNFPHLLHAPDEAAPYYPTPRGWEFVSRVLLQSPDPATELALVAGIVGHGAAVEFAAFARIYRSLNAHSLDAILHDPTGAPVPGPDQPGLRYAIAHGLSARADVTNLGAVTTYLDRLPNDYAQFAMQLATRRDRRLCSTPEYTQWAIKHSQD